MRVVNLGVRNHCVLQQMRAGARLGITRHTHSRVPKTSRQEPYSESTVWVIIQSFGDSACLKRFGAPHIFELVSKTPRIVS